MNKEYLGDGIYAEFDDFGIALTTENGVDVTNTIYLEPAVAIAVVEFLDRVEKLKTKTGEGAE